MQFLSYLVIDFDRNQHRCPVVHNSSVGYASAVTSSDSYNFVVAVVVDDGLVPYVTEGLAYFVVDIFASFVVVLDHIGLFSS